MLSINDSSPVPPFEQIRAQLSDLIRSGALEPSQRLPSIRQLAGDLRVASGTVARAYSELETAGLISTSRATGAKVCAGHGFTDDVQRAASNFVTAAQESALSLEDALGAIRSQWPPA
ncbi:GntR family transcriptional regulator [Arthrobacter sp. BF1]|uniref:GntR family transcriptional regulator n=1 Tax=Arthrobacter sp. BF1 TaxID=2821145 RepID=UPI001C4EF11A|nr:GntR family transcriptional regulator [Arthrobacter sp. BF1]